MKTVLFLCKFYLTTFAACVAVLVVMSFGPHQTPANLTYMNDNITKDKHGIVGQIQKDGSVEGGDSANYMGHYVFLTHSDFPYAKAFEVAFGAYVRHPDPKMTNNGFGAYYKNPWNGCISRDQLTGILLALIRQQDHKAMARLIAHNMATFGIFTYNTIHNGEDPNKAKWKFPDTMLSLWGLQLRGFGWASWLFYPILTILDLHLLAGVILDRYVKLADHDVINFTGRLLASKEFVPTPTSMLAAKLVDQDDYNKRMKRAWCGWRDNCGMAKLLAEAMKKTF